jgi:hypothetical protein
MKKANLVYAVIFPDANEYVADTMTGHTLNPTLNADIFLAKTWNQRGRAIGFVDRYNRTKKRYQEKFFNIYNRYPEYGTPVVVELLVTKQIKVV